MERKPTQYFIGAADPVTRRIIADANIGAALRMGMGAAPPKSSSSKRAAYRRLGLDEDATEQELYDRVTTLASKGEREIERQIEPIKQRSEDRAPLSMRRGPKVAFSRLAHEARRILAAGQAKDIGEAQRIAAARDPSLLRG